MKDAASVLQALAEANRREHGERISATRVYSIKLDGDVKAKLAPQAIACLKVIFAIGKASVNEVDLHTALMAHPEISRKQSPWDIFRHYRKTLCEAKFLSYTK